MAFNAGASPPCWLLVTLIAGELALIFRQIRPLEYISAASALAGFLLVIASAILVLIESVIARNQIEQELADLTEFSKH